MQAPQVDVLTDEGSRVPLASFYANRPVALVFLRHLGCIFCREQIAGLKHHPDLNVVLVGLSTPEEALVFKQEVGTALPMICDPGKHLFQAFGLTRGTNAQILNFRTITRGIRAYRHGYRQTKPMGDPFQLPGAFVIDTEGQIVWEYKGKDAADFPAADVLKDELCKASEGRLGAAG
jgi:peroxiredoxin